MKHAIAIIALLLISISALGQARTAEAIVSVIFSRLNEGNPPDGSVRTLINGTPGSTPCTSGSVKVFAIKLNGVWNCPNLGSGAGTGNVTGPSNSAVGELPLFTTTTGTNLGRSNTLSGIVSLSSGFVTTLQSSGTGDVARVAGPALTGLNASTVFSSGTIPPARIISNALTPNTCLRLSSAGAIETAAADCGVGGGGAPGGVNGNLTYNQSGSFGALLNTSYSSLTGVLTFTQLANGNDTLVGLRATDTSPTGTFLRFRDAANTTNLFTVGTDGTVFISSATTVKNIAAPATPSTGNTVLYADTTDKNLKAKDDAGQVTLTVRATACSGTDKVSSISSAGVVTCSADQTSPGGTGITTLNTLTAADQTFADVDDTNVTLNIASVTSTHTFTLGWTGTLAKARQNASTTYVDQANTWTTGAQSFAAATSLTLPTAAGATPTASASIAYDSTSHTLEYGENGTNRIVANIAGTQTFSNKVLDSSTTYAARDTLFTLQDNADATKTVNFELGGLTTSTNRVVTIVDAASLTVRPSTATTNQWVTHIDSTGVQQKAQPAFSNLSGSLAVTQGSTGQTTVTQGDILYGDATNSWARLAKSATATRYLSNTGTSNNPAWTQVDLTNGVMNVLPPANWSPLTTKGDVVVHNGTTTTRLAVGTNGFALIADSAQTAGVRWGAITATAGGSTTQLQVNTGGSLAGITGATSDGTSVTFADGALVLNGGDYGASDATLPASPTEKSFYLNTNASSRRLFIYNDGSYRELFQAGIAAVNLASANVIGTLPLANGGLGITSGTSGGIPYFSSTSTVASSAALTANLPVIGGGAGVAPSVGTRSGNTTAFVTTTGTQTSGRCVEIDASGNHIAAAAACSSGSGANTSLSNLASVAINTALVSDTDLTDDLGTSSIRWKDAWAGGVIIGGKSVTTEADNSVGILSGSVTYAKNDTNTRTFFGNLIKPILNTGGSNTNTTLNVLAVDTTNTATTGLTTNLMNLAYGGSSKFKVASDGTATVPTGTLTVTIASGTASLGTSAIASGATATTVTVSATGVATTDVILWDFNSDPTGVTGYQASANGMLTIITFPTNGNVNFKVANNTASSITPGAITLNWRVQR